jgi:PAS domain S-box-containing protein
MTLGRRIAVGIILALVLLAGVGYAGYTSIRRLVGDSRRIESTHEINTRLEHLLSRVKDAETGSRGFIITGDDQYLQPYDTARDSIPRDIATLRGLIADPISQDQLETLARWIAADLAFMAAPIEARRTTGFHAAQTLVLSGRVKAATDTIRRRVGEMQLRRTALLSARRAQTARSTRAALLVIIGILVVAGIFSVGGAVLARKALIERARVMQARERFFTVSRDLLCTAGPDGRLTDLNAAWERTLGYTLEEISSRPFLSFVHPDDREKTKRVFERLFAGEPVPLFENRYLHQDRTYRSLLWSAALDPGQGRVYGAARDITDLEATRAELHRLSGLLPICASCKKIRDDQGYWSQIETYISEHSAAQFSHGICPECGEQLYGALYS